MAGILLFAWIAASAAQPATEGPADSDASSSETIIVTGERVKRTLRDTPSSVAVIDESVIESKAANRLDQLLAAIPNVQLGNGSEGPAIRGEDTTGVLQALDGFLGGARPRATTEVDGRAVGFQEYIFGTAPLWDVKQVEVFRSPLTVTHGRNSIAGGIVITTNDPTLDWEVRARGIVGKFDTREASAVLSGPLIADELAFRLAGDFRHQRTTSKLSDHQRGANPNDDDYSIVRFKLLAKPKAVPGLRVLGTFTHSYSQMPQVVDAKEPFKPREDPQFDAGVFGVRVNAGTVRATQDLGNGQIEAVLSVGRSHSRRFAPPGIGEANIKLRDLSGDLFGSLAVADGVTVRGGVHALDSQLRQYIDLRGFIGSEGRFRDHQQSFGAFAEAEWEITPRLKLATGGRYQEDEQRRKGGLAGGVTAPVDFDLRYSSWLPKLSLTYALSPAMNAGVLIERAYNPGGATIALNTGETDTFDAETMLDYEAFLKGTVPGLPVTVAANIFYQDKFDAQRGVLVPFTLPDGGHDAFVRFNNVPRAHAYGAELEVSWRAAANLTLRSGVGALRTRVDRAAADDDIGKEFERAPDWSGSASADWSPARKVQLFAQLRYRAGYASDNFDTTGLRVPSSVSLDARAAYDVGRFTIFAYAQNLLDRINILYRYDADYAELEDPRVVGVGIDARF